MLQRNLVNLCFKPQMLPPPHQGFSWFKSLPPTRFPILGQTFCRMEVLPFLAPTAPLPYPVTLGFLITIKTEDVGTGNLQTSLSDKVK